MKKTITSLLSLACLLGGSLSASDFPEIFNSEEGEKPLPSPEEALEMLELPEGFTASIFAAEPEVQNPIAMAWDAQGRAWVAENYTYAERATRFELGLRDRVIVLEDTNGDGKADERKVFTDNVQMLTGIEVGRGGVWLMCPPQMLFIPDADGDAEPDGPAEVVLDGFTVAQANYHNFANGLKWGPDGWLYGRCGGSCPGDIGKPGTPDDQRIPLTGGIWRYDLKTERVEVLCHGTTNPWGHDWDNHGEAFFINTVNGHLWHMIPGAHLRRPFMLDPNPGVYEPMEMIADHWHFDTEGSWTDSRDGAANRFGGGHAHIGMMIYQGESWPQEYRDKLFTLNMHGRRANVETLKRSGSGYVGTHEPDAFIWGDEWFRGIEISQAPDGSALVLDWSDTGECHEHTGVHRKSGRIYRIAAEGSTAAKDVDLRKLSAVELAGLHSSENEWAVRMARRILLERGEGVEELLPMLNEEPEVLLRALWTLHGLGAADADLLKGLLEDENEHVRVWTVRLLTDRWPIDTALSGRPDGDAPTEELNDLLPTFVAMARDDDSSLVRLTLSSTLQRLPFTERADLASALVSRSEDAADKELPSMVWYGLIPVGEAAPMDLVQVANASTWPDATRFISRNVASRIESEPEVFAALLDGAMSRSAGHQFSLMSGASEAFQGWQKAPAPENWEAFVASLSDDAPADLRNISRELSALFGDGRALDEIRAVALDKGADIKVRKAALQTLIDNRPEDLQEICEQLLGTRLLNPVVVRGLSLFEDPKIAELMTEKYRRFHPLERPAMLEALVSRPSFAGPLLDAVGEGKIATSDLTAFHIRQIHGFGDEELTARATEVWGELRESSAEKLQTIEDLKELLTDDYLEGADLSMGRVLFQSLCSSCHVLYGQGGKLGPDLTGSGRDNLDYLLENIVDPSGVVPAETRMTILTMKDGRVLSGLVATEDNRTLTLRTLSEELSLPKREISNRETSSLSIMPEGLIQALTEEMKRDLIAYLKHPSQVPLPGEAE